MEMSGYSVSQIHFTERSRTTTRTPASYWLLLAFLFLLYANLPIVMPALDALHLAKVVAGLALVMLLAERAFARESFEFAWPEGCLLLGFLGAAALSSVTALWPHLAADSVSDLLKMTIVFFFIVNCANTERRLRGVMWIMVIGGLLPAAGTLRNYLQGNMVDGRAAWVGIFANPNELAYGLVILLPLAAYLATGLGLIPRLALLGVALVYVAAILVTFSRGGVLGLGAVLGLYAWRKRSILLQGLVALLVVAGLILAGRFWSRGEDFKNLNADVSFRQRLATSQAGLAMFADHPLLGVGLGCSVIAWPLYAPEGLYTRGALVTHNTFIQALGETGAIGFIPFILFVGFGLYHARKLALESSGTGSANLGAGIEIAVWGFVVCGLSGGYVLTWFPYILFGLAASARQITGKTR
jgi:putative inorganic carbon (HCO3(-)) transporter